MKKKIIETSKINIYTYKNNINSSIPEKQKLTSTLILTNDNDTAFVFLSPVSELLDMIIITNIPNYYGFFVASIVPFFYLTQLMIMLSLSSLIIKLLHQSYISFSILIDNLCKKAFEYKYYKMISFISKKLDFIIYIFILTILQILFIKIFIKLLSSGDIGNASVLLILKALCLIKNNNNKFYFNNYIYKQYIELEE